MKIKIQVVIELDNGNTQTIQEVSKIERSGLQPENLGLSIAESKVLLQNIQSTLVERQVAEYLAQNSSCLHCEKKLLHKDKRTIVYRTVFGKLNLHSQRLFYCACQEQPTRYFNPIATLLSQRTSPERLYLESKFAALMSYGLSVKLLQEVLPIEGEINASSIRNNLHSCGQRLEEELGEEKGGYIEGCQREWEKLPIPDLPLVVGMDGGYLRSTKPKLAKLAQRAKKVKVRFKPLLVMLLRIVEQPRLIYLHFLVFLSKSLFRFWWSRKLVNTP